MNKFHFPDRRIWVVVGVVVLVILMMDFNNRMAAMLKLNQQASNLKVEATQLGATRQSLDTQIAYATSEAAVPEWARVEGHMRKTGDVLVVPIAPANNSTPEAAANPLPVQEKAESWQIWYALFFGS
jgi:cell division protein FtsB